MVRMVFVCRVVRTVAAANLLGIFGSEWIENLFLTIFVVGKLSLIINLNFVGWIHQIFRKLL